MSSVFKDQGRFMKACNQTVDRFNKEQFDLYIKLIDEEAKEVVQAVKDNDRQEILKELLDLIVVAVGAIHSLGADGEGAWKEVIRSNMSKVDKETGKIRKREDGKILKPVGFSPANITPFLKIVK